MNTHPERKVKESTINKDPRNRSKHYRYKYIISNRSKDLQQRLRSFLCFFNRKKKEYCKVSFWLECLFFLHIVKGRGLRMFISFFVSYPSFIYTSFCELIGSHTCVAVAAQLENSHKHGVPNTPEQNSGLCFTAPLQFFQDKQKT